MLLETSISKHNPKQPLDVLEIELSQPEDLVCTSSAAYVSGLWHGIPVGYLLVKPGQHGRVVGQRLARLFEQHRVEEIVRAELELAAFPNPWLDATYSVAVCTADRTASLQRCLTSLSQLSSACAEVIIVDNSQRESEAVRVLVESAAEVSPVPIRYVREPLPGLDRSRNRALVTAGTDLLLFTDDDVEITQGWDSWLVDGFRDPLVMAAAGLVQPASLRTSSQIRSEQFCSHSRGFKQITYGAPHRYPLSSPQGRPATPGVGAAMAVRRLFALSVGGFPDELDAGMPTGTGGDTWMFRTVLSRGYRVAYQPRSMARHWHRESDEALTRLFTANSCGVWALNWKRMNDVGLRAGLSAMANTMKWHRATLKHVRRNDPGALPGKLLRAELVGATTSRRNYRQAVAKSKDRPSIIDEMIEAPAPWMAERTSELAMSHDKSGLPDLTVCIPTRGRREWVTDLVNRLASLPAVTEIVVAIDGDIDGTAAALRRLADALPQGDMIRWTVLASASNDSEHGNGAGAARNAAVELAKSGHLLFLDDDVLPADEDLARLHLLTHRERQQRSEVPAIVVGHAHVDRRDSLSHAEHRGRNWWTDHGHRLDSEVELGFADLCTGNMSVDSKTLDRLGGFPAVARREDWMLGLTAEQQSVPIVAVRNAAVGQRDESRSTARLERLRDGMGDAVILSQFPDYRQHISSRLWPKSGPWSWIGSIAARYPERYLAMEPVVSRLARRIPPINGLRGRANRLLTICNYWAGASLAVGTDNNPLLETRAQCGPTPTISLDLAECEASVGTGSGRSFNVLYRSRHIGHASAIGEAGVFPLWRLRRCLIDHFAPEIAAAKKYGIASDGTIGRVGAT